MKRLLTLLSFLGVGVFATSQELPKENPVAQENLVIQLPAPSFDSKTSVENALLTRRSERVYLQDAIKLKDLSQILWAAQGVTWKIDTMPRVFIGEKWFGSVRTAPSAGALFPIELYIAAGNVESLDPALYKYNALNHTIVKVMDGDKREDVRKAALNQIAVKNGQACIIIAANFGRTEYKYKARATQYVYIESGAVSQNIYLQCNTLGIGTVLIGAIREEPMKVALGLPDSETPISVMPIGYLIPKKE
jgi:SagB-type dehydrogenase family enzyme